MYDGRVIVVVLRVGTHDREPSRPQDLVHGLVVPRGVPELERRREAFREDLDEGREPIDVDLEVGGELEEDHAQSGTQRVERRDQVLGRLTRLGLESREVRDPTRSL